MIKEVLEILGRRSVKAFRIANQRLLSDRTKNVDVHRALEYYGKNWTDVLHPGIVAVACEVVGGSEKDSILMQVPMLFFTAAADVHDDVLDGSQTKSGKTTILGKFGKEIALLVGDRMLFMGMEGLYASGKEIATEKMDSIIAAIENAFVEVTDAHATEMKFKRRLDPNPEEYFCMLEKKSSILEAHARIGALVGNGNKNETESLAQYGRILGTLITLRDEFIDLFEPQELSDRLRNGCLPLPIIYVLEDPAAKRIIEGILSRPRISKRDVATIVDLAFEDQQVKCLRDKMEDLSNEAIKLTAGLLQQQNLQLLVNALLEGL